MLNQSNFTICIFLVFCNSAILNCLLEIWTIWIIGHLKIGVHIISCKTSYCVLQTQMGSYYTYIEIIAKLQLPWTNLKLLGKRWVSVWLNATSGLLYLAWTLKEATIKRMEAVAFGFIEECSDFWIEYVINQQRNWKREVLTKWFNNCCSCSSTMNLCMQWAEKLSQP